MTFFYDLNKKLQGVLEQPKSVHQQLNERDEGKPGKNFAKIVKTAGEKYGSKEAGERVAGAVRAKLAKQGKLEEEQMDEGLGDLAKKVGGAVKKGAKAVGKAIVGMDDDELLRDLQKKAGIPAHAQHGKKNMAQANEGDFGPMEGVDKEKFAALAPPKDKITFADKIAGAKKEVDEMLGDVAADAIKKAITSKGGTVTKTKTGIKHSAGPGVYGGSDNDSHPLDRMKGPSKKRLTGKGEMDEGWDEMMKSVRDRAEKPKVGTVDRGHKHDIEWTATGRKVTRRVDDQGNSVGADDDESSKADAPKRGRGRPKGTGSKIGSKGPSGKSKLMTKEAAGPDDLAVLERLMDEAFADGKNALGNAIQGVLEQLSGKEEVDEKAVSKAQQRFMGMVHATQKGEKAPSKEVAKVAKSMGKKDAEDFASTKHKGLPEKKKPEAKKSDAPKKKKEKTEEAGGSGTPTASSGFGFGKGIYDSYNREVEDMIAESMSRLSSTLNESMNVSMSSNSDGGHGGPTKSLTVSATDDDAVQLASILKNAGLSGGDEHSHDDHEVEVVGVTSPISGAEGHEHEEGECPTCGSHDCGCGDIEEALDENNPDWPTNTETSNDPFQYSGGLNKPKTDVAGDGQATTPVVAVHSQDEDALRRLREMAGIQEAAKPDFADIDKDGDEKETAKKAAKDAEKDKALEESILDMSNLWKTYKG